MFSGQKKPEGMARIQGPLLVTYPTVEGGHIRLMVQNIVAVRPNGPTTYVDGANGLTYHIAMREDEFLKDLNGYEY